MCDLTFFACYFQAKVTHFSHVAIFTCFHGNGRTCSQKLTGPMATSLCVSDCRLTMRLAETVTFWKIYWACDHRLMAVYHNYLSVVNLTCAEDEDNGSFYIFPIIESVFFQLRYIIYTLIAIYHICINSGG